MIARAGLLTYPQIEFGDDTDASRLVEALSSQPAVISHTLPTSLLPWSLKSWMHRVPDLKRCYKRDAGYQAG